MIFNNWLFPFSLLSSLFVFGQREVGECSNIECGGTVLESYEVHEVTKKTAPFGSTPMCLTSAPGGENSLKWTH